MAATASLSDIRAILFDKDGTLLDFNKTWSRTNRAAALLAADGDGELAARLLRAGGMDALTGNIEGGSLLAAGNTIEIADAWIEAGSPVGRDVLIPAVDALFVQAAQDAVPSADLAALLSGLSDKGYVLGVASSDNEAGINAMIDRFMLSEWISFAAGYDSGFGHKPGPGMLDGFCQHAGMDAQLIAVVGDSLHDMEMARSGGAGLRIAVLSGSSSDDVLRPVADICIGNVAELAALFSATDH